MKVFESLHLFSDCAKTMNEPEGNPDTLPPPWNPYSPPAETPRVPVANKLPKSYWPVVVGFSLPLFLVALYTYGMTLPFALSTSLGGIRTALIYGACRKMDRQPPSCYGSLFLSAFWCFLFQFVSAVAFVFICASGGNHCRSDHTRRTNFLSRHHRSADYLLRDVWLVDQHSSQQSAAD